MSLHPSLRIDTAGAQQRTVLTRIERIKGLMKKGLWQEGQRVTGLPKTKIIKIKAKKAAKAPAEELAGAAAPAEGVAAAVAPEGKAKAEGKPKAEKSKGKE